MVLGNVASSPLLDSTRSMQLSAISSTPSRTPCGPLLRFGRRITSIERLGGSPLVPRLLRSFHWEYRSKECAELRNLEETYILNTNLTSRGKKLLKLLISKTRLIKIFEVYRDKPCWLFSDPLSPAIQHKDVRRPLRPGSFQTRGRTRRRRHRRRLADGDPQ